MRNSLQLRFLITLFIGYILYPSFASGTTRIFCSHTIESLAWSPNNQFLALQGYRGTTIYDVHLYPITTLEESEFIDLSLGAFDVNVDEYSNCWGAGVAWSPNGTHLVAPFINPSDHTTWLRVWDVNISQAVYEVSSPQPRWFDISVIEWSPKTNYIAVVGRGEIGENSWAVFIQRMDQENKPVLNDKNIFAYGDGVITDIAWHFDGNRLAVSRYSGQIEVWDVTHEMLGRTADNNIINEFRRVFSLHSSPVNTIAWQPFGELLAIGYADGTIQFLDTQTTEITQLSAAHRAAVNAISWNSEGTMIASADDDGLIHLWDIETYEKVLSFEEHNSIHMLDWSQDGSLIASASENNIVHLWAVK